MDNSFWSYLNMDITTKQMEMNKPTAIIIIISGFVIMVTEVLLLKPNDPHIIKWFLVLLGFILIFIGLCTVKEKEDK